MKPFALSVVAGVLFALAGGCSSAPPPPADPGLPFRQEGDAALAQGDADHAIASYQLALALEPSDVAALRGLLDAQVAAGDGRAALVSLAALEAASQEPVDPCPALTAATEAAIRDAQRGQGEAAAAPGPARRAHEAGCAGADLGLARVLDARAAAAEPDRAVELRLEAISLDPSDPSRYVAAARLLLAGNRTDEATRLLAAGLERHPGDRTLRDLMVRALSIR